MSGSGVRTCHRLLRVPPTVGSHAVVALVVYGPAHGFIAILMHDPIADAIGLPDPGSVTA
jgi:hypothetical protein